MILFFFLFIQFNKSLSSRGSCSCQYDFNTKEYVCDSNCREDLVESDRLYQCPSARFKQRLPLWKWLLAEMFCITKDNRGDVSVNYQQSSNINYDTPPAFTTSQNTQPTSTLSYGSTINIMTDNPNVSFTYPTISLISSLCGKSKKANFLVSTTSTCYYEINATSQNFVDDYIQELDNYAEVNKSTIPFNISYTNVNSSITTADESSQAEFLSDIEIQSSVENSQFVSSIYIQFYVSGMSLSSANVVIERKPLDGQSILPLSVSVDYITQSQSDERLKSGDFGYAYGQPVIALQQGSFKEEPFPVPYGLDSIEYTPLLFGVDVFSGFPFNATINFFTNNLRLSKLGQGNPTFRNDWIPVSTSYMNDAKCYTLNIYYVHVGNVNNPQNMIHSANLIIPINQFQLSSNQTLFKCSFLKVSVNPYHRYLQANPRVKGIPPDTFYPFSRDDSL